MSSSKTEDIDKILKNELGVCLKVIAALRDIRSKSGFGRIELDVKDNRVVAIITSDRVHLE